MRVLRSFGAIFGAILAVMPCHISEAQTVTLNFASVSLPAGGCTDASAYLASFGITFVADTSGATAQICNASGSSIYPTSSPNFFFIGPPVTNTNVSGDLVFSTPVTQISFGTTAVSPATSVPGWDADAYNASSTLLSSVSEPSLYPGPGAMSYTLAGPGITRLHFDAFNSAARTYNFPPIDHFTLMPTACQATAIGQQSVPPGVQFIGTVDAFAGYPYSLNGKPESENAIFAPGSDPSGSNPLSLQGAANLCGFSGFNWQQTITNLPAPSDPTKCNLDGPFSSPHSEPNCLAAISAPFTVLTAGPPPNGPSFLDPVPGGYTYELPNGDNANPFYFAQADLTKCIIDGFRFNVNGCVDPEYPPDPTSVGGLLLFSDRPTNPLLPSGQYVSYTTSLVGIFPSGSTANLFSWSWTSNFNGTTMGGVAKNLSLPDPNSGTGGVTITSINGVPQTPPSVSCTATPNTKWPPDGQAVSVTVSGIVTPGTSSLVPGGTTYLVTNEHGRDLQSGQITLGSGGSYLFQVWLRARRDRNDHDDHHGRTYTIIVDAQDTLGNVGSCSAIVTVPRDHRH